VLEEADERDLMFWHATKALKAAVKNKHLLIVRYMIEELHLDLCHDAFERYLHLFLFGCQEAEMMEGSEE
jgi:hypothetical protein